MVQAHASKSNAVYWFIDWINISDQAKHSHHQVIGVENALLTKSFCYVEFLNQFPLNKKLWSLGILLCHRRALPNLFIDVVKKHFVKGNNWELYHIVHRERPKITCRGSSSNKVEWINVFTPKDYLYLELWYNHICGLDKTNDAHYVNIKDANVI